jgi:glycosyltransferase involved in cell wall biosynthesis
MQVKNVIIVNDFNYTQGGASKVAIDTAKLLKQEGFRVIFFSAVNKEDDEKIEGVEYISTNQDEALKEKNKIKGSLNGIYNLKAKKELKKLLKTLDRTTTIIHVHGWTKALSCSVFDVAFKMKFKVVLTLHDYFTACPNGGYFDYKENKICKRKPLSWQCIKCNCDSRNYIFKLYRLVRQFVQNKIVKLPKKIKYAIGISDLSIDILKSTLNKNIQLKKIYNPIDFDENVEKVDYTKNEYYLYVGRISKEKGVDVFCQAVTELGLKGIAVGDGTEKERLETEYPNIEFTGWKNSNGVKKYMKGAKALIFPSLCYETAGLTILEALSLNKIVLVNNTCAGREFVSDEYLFKDYKDLIYKLKNIDNITKINYNLKKYSSENYENNILVYLKEINELG